MLMNAIHKLSILCYNSTMTLQRKLLWPLAAFTALVPGFVAAFTLGNGDPIVVNTGVSTTADRLIGGLVNTLFVWAFAICVAVFLLGALFMVASGGEENVLSNGKKYVKRALIGLAIVLGSWMILSTFVYFLVE